MHSRAKGAPLRFLASHAYSSTCTCGIKLTLIAVRELYPDGLLEETEETLDLLFPTKNIKDSKRTRRLRDKDDVDIEAARDLPPSMTISHYKHWGDRLALVQQAYDTARPRRGRQWWYDRRNRVEWATLLVAIIVFIMTLVFGIISSVTGIMQVYASFRSLK